MHRLLAIGLMALALGCGDDKKDGAGGAAGKPPAGVDGVLAAWKEAGLTVSAFEPADAAKYGGGECKSGAVSGVDAVVCNHASAEAAKEAVAKGLEVVGTAKSGSALAAGTMLLVIADRRDADPQGKTINQATKIFRGK